MALWERAMLVRHAVRRVPDREPESELEEPESRDVLPEWWDKVPAMPV